MQNTQKPAAPDLTTDFPRSGRETLGGWAWLARIADKVRAAHAGKAGEYVAYCPQSTGFLNRAGVSRDAFDKLIRDGATDDELVAYFEKHAAANKQKANDYILVDTVDHVEKQDVEEGRTAK
jgi:hypothetical protein